MNPLLMVAALPLGTFAADETAAKPPYLDPGQPTERRVRDLISRMTLEEKASQMCHGAPAIERLGVPETNGWNQCLHGVCAAEPTTMFPVPITMAATWNPALIEQVAAAISDEARALNNIGAKSGRGKLGLFYRAPVINISRDPRWGRINECYGEDPFLTSRIGVAFVKGLQGDHPKYLKLVSTLKHYAVNNQETGRTSLSAEVGERLLHEYWLPHFRACITEGRAQSIMAAYNAINGVPCVVSKLLLTDILRERWGFGGFVVSDTGGIRTLVRDHRFTERFDEAVAKAVLAGCDLDDDQFPEHLPEAVRRGLLSERDLDRALGRILTARFRLGEFDPPQMVPYRQIPPDVVGCREHRDLALRTAREGIVLLSNRDRFLPLDRSRIESIAVIGPHADAFTAGGYSGKAAEPVTPLAGISNRAAAGTQVVYAKGCDILEAGDKEGAFEEAIAIARECDVVILFLGTDLSTEREGLDRADIGLPGAQEELLRAIYAANRRTAVVLLNAGPLSIRWARDSVPAIVAAGWAGEEGGNAIADVLFGDYNPGGRLPYTVYESLAQVPPQAEYDMTKGFTYMYLEGEALFPFGHGLSYTSFDYRNLAIAPKRIGADGEVRVSVDVRNTGDREGDEVVQLYVHDAACTVKRPIKELRGFQRIHLRPGGRKRVRLTVRGEDLSFYDVTQRRFVVEPGAFEVLVGSSSADIRVRGSFEVVAGK